MSKNRTNKFAKFTVYCGLFILFPSIAFCQQVKGEDIPTTNFSWGKELIEHYRHSNDQEKFQAACFLISSMPGHHSPTGKTIHEYITTVNNCKLPCSQDTLSHYWIKSLKHNDSEIRYTEDTLLLNKNFLISHIEQAIQAWRNAPWHKDISFEDFCHYILPYRVSDEIINLKGRNILASKYSSLIKEETDIVKAFAVICNTMFKQIRQTNTQCPYTLDAHTIDYLQQGNCLQRCILLTEVLRSLGIPCTIDIVPLWGNYSQTGHSWVAMPYKGMNYTWRERDSIARTDNPIDASHFQVTYQPTVNDNYPYPIENRKKTAKIYRLRYQKNAQSHTKDAPELFTQRLDDVSATYNLTNSITLTSPTIKNKVYYLCTFQSGKGWTPIACASSLQKDITFYNVGHDLVYILASFEQGIIYPVSLPFLLKETGELKFFHTDKNNIIKCRLHRKYPIFSQWTNQWGNMIGGTFEGSNNPNFSNIDTLAIITSMPLGETIIPIETNKVYRYVRYHSTNNSRTPLAELGFYNANKRSLNGIPISHSAVQKSKERVFDGDIATEGYTKQVNYWVGLDLSDTIQSSISSIKFFPKNDGNFVTRGKFYELFYYDNGWESLGERFSVNDYVEYNIPEGALLWLKCDTGNEERIFEYKEGRQVWY